MADPVPLDVELITSFQALSADAVEILENFRAFVESEGTAPIEFRLSGGVIIQVPPLQAAVSEAKRTSLIYGG